MAEDDFRFARPELAARFADDLIGRGPFDFRSGLFLAAPRRTGKSTFLREDLVPALEAREVLTVYVDLWADRVRDPAELVYAALAKAQDKATGWLHRLAKRVRPRSIDIPGIASIDLTGIGTATGPTMTEALAELAMRARSDIALILDEAQHALSSNAGLNMMFALKAARDAFNQSGGEGRARLLLVFTGSDRDKLSDLVFKRDQPFFGAILQEFPYLGDDFCVAYTNYINTHLQTDKRFAESDVREAFVILGRRPEMLAEVMKNVLFGAGPNGLIAAAGQRRDRLLDSYAATFFALAPLQQSVLRIISGSVGAFRPFAAATLTELAASIGVEVTAPQVQRALDALRKSGLIWNSARGGYAIADPDMAAWLAGTCP